MPTAYLTEGWRRRSAAVTAGSSHTSRRHALVPAGGLRQTAVWLYRRAASVRGLTQGPAERAVLRGAQRVDRLGFRTVTRRVKPYATTSMTREVVTPAWAWILIIVLLVLLLTGGVYVRR